MKKLILAAAAVAAVTAAIPAIASTGRSARSTVGLDGLKISLVFKTQKIVYNPPRHAKPNAALHDGDFIAFTDVVISAGHKIGTNKGLCMAEGFPEFVCTTTMRLAGGTIAMHGIYNGASTAPQSIAIVGGTGRYESVLGQFTGRNVGATNFDGTITLSH